jgi:quinol monooxygenase YgiN
LDGMKVRHFFFLCSVILVMTGAPSYGQVKEAYVRVAEIEIDPGQSLAYLEALKEQIEAALRIEAGVVALYSVADKENPAHITVFEIYRDAEAYKTHVETEHFKKYKTVTKDIVKSLKLRETIPIFLGVKKRR